MLEAHRAAGILWPTVSSLPYTTAPGATGRGSQPSRSWRLASAAKVTEQQATDWLKKQAIWQIYLPALRRVPRPKFDVAVPNEIHQADLLFLPQENLPLLSHGR